MESTRIDPLRPTQRNLDSSSSGEALNLNSGSSEGANQQHAANKKAEREEARFEKQNKELQKIIEDLHQKIEKLGKEKSEREIKISKLEEKIIEVEEINSKEVDQRRNIELELEIARQAYDSRPNEKTGRTSEANNKACCETLLKRIEIEHIIYII